MTTTTTKTTFPAVSEEMKAAAARYPGCLAAMMELQKATAFKGWYTVSNEAEQSAYFADKLELKTKEDYIEMRDALKAWLRLMETTQRSLKEMTSRPGDQSGPQMHKHFGAGLVTQLIEIRRAGKIWSSNQAKTKVEVAA
ncbi:hypothetical protein LCGC14_0044650 [marine sediment metagenome]|uniref:Uncharacterized protein n=2 Tax=root TaxID=1 RepID=A0A7V1BIM4_9RHOB|nr:hypothetical protein [Sulfitobacter litoralis]HDZ53510.1 hypothetical protein [Sulfitobacter litoralis]